MLSLATAQKANQNHKNLENAHSGQGLTVPVETALKLCHAHHRITQSPCLVPAQSRTLYILVTLAALKPTALTSC
jgi:hypothetical protein